MIVSTNDDGIQIEFEDLLDITVSTLREDADNYLGRSSSEFELDVKGILDEKAIGTSFEDTIILMLEPAFPDIITEPERFPFGVEVKTTRQNHWTTVGNSILESTRVEGIDYIYLLFGKLVRPIDFRFRRYEECLYDVAVTHSPRYLINMALAEGETLFDKMELSYDELRRREDPISPIKSYYRSILRPGESLWWLETIGEELRSSNIVIRMWNSLEHSQRDRLIVMAMAFFPEIFRSGNRFKYSRLATWLANEYAILDSSLRDRFTAGGQVTITVADQSYQQIPKIIENLRIKVPAIVQFLNNPENLPNIEECWEREVQPDETIEIWISLIEENARSLFGERPFPLREMIAENMRSIMSTR